jgi:hypothetical protein
VVDLAHRRELVVLLPTPDELAHPLHSRRVLRYELYGHAIAYVPTVRSRQVLGGVLNLHLHPRRVEREVDGYARRDFLHEATAEDIVLEIRLKHRDQILTFRSVCTPVFDLLTLLASPFADNQAIHLSPSAA